MDPELLPNPSPVPAAVVAVEPVEPEPVEPVAPVAEGGAVVAVVVEVDVAVSGETHPAGGDAAPCWPGMSTLPAQPKSE
ncbi:MAG: hypothetical protein P4L20_05200, partial [Acidimicrobiales bacterium]|nr:hypothetical protein [Acidimicrobiales bacterium]